MTQSHPGRTQELLDTPTTQDPLYPETLCPAFHLYALSTSVASLPPPPHFCSTKPLLEVDKADWLLNVLQVLLLGNHPTLQLRLCQPRSNPW